MKHLAPFALLSLVIASESAVAQSGEQRVPLETLASELHETGRRAMPGMPSTSARSAASHTTRDGIDTAIAATADSLLTDLHARGLFDGAVILGREGRIVFAKAWVRDSSALGRPLGLDTPVDGASLAKTFTAAAIWMLADEGRLTLEDPVQRHVPEFPYAGTTVRQLLEHGVGLPEWSDLFALGDTMPHTNAELVAALRASGRPPAFPPGSRHAYCNACFDVAALVAERASGRRYDDFLRERVFLPLGMDSVFLRPVRLADWRGPRTLSATASPGGRRVRDVLDREAFYGSANLYFTAHDLHRWASSFLTAPVLPPATLARGLTTPTLGDGERSRLTLLNWYRSSDGDRFHFSGHHLGFHHEVYWDRRRRHSVVWLTNDETVRPLPPLLTRALADLLDGRRPALAPVRSRASPAPDASTATATGDYMVDGIGAVSVTPSPVEGELLVRVGRGSAHRCYGTADCYLPDFDVFLEFADPVDGAFERILWTAVDTVTDGRRRRPTPPASSEPR